MQIGDINVANTLLNLQSKVMVLEQVLGYIMEKNPNIDRPNHKTMELIENNALKQLQELYPNMGIKKNSQ
ncbi:MAG: hypothetical protein U0U70_13200 [Chitinophagaceae bacterium]